MKNFLSKLLKSRKFYLTLIFPLFIIFLLTTTESKGYSVLLGFFLGITSLPVLVTMLEIYKPEKYGS